MASTIHLILECIKSFEEGFLGYVAAAPHYQFDVYRQLVHEITQEFQRISQLILAEKEALKDVHKRSGSLDLEI
jgi:hypothetical protein